MPPEAPSPVSGPSLEARLDVYDLLLHKWQAKINLVSPSTLPDLRVRHFEDSLQLLPFIPAEAHTLYDLGSGAGFPGLVLAMARPDLSVHLFEVDQRKSAFLQTVSRETQTPVSVHVARVESSILPAPDVVTARALAALPELLSLTERWWSARPDCALIFPKGASVYDEIFAARQGYDFEMEVHESRTSREARILVLKNVKKKEG